MGTCKMPDKESNEKKTFLKRFFLIAVFENIPRFVYPKKTPPRDY
jgi:hypothetical protein